MNTFSLVELNAAYNVGVELAKMNPSQIAAIAEFLVQHHTDAAQELEFALSCAFKEEQCVG